MPLFWIDPMQDPRWATFVDRHPDASIFHTPGWIRSLCRTYGYTAVTLTTSSPDEELTNGIPFCRIRSRLTGHRLVSLPFSDHCEPLFTLKEERDMLFDGLRQWFDRESVESLEMRPVSDNFRFDRAATAESFYFHKLDLSPTPDQLMAEFHKDCIQRKIRRAQREGIKCRSGRSEALLNIFYKLNVMTRRRHRLLPQPIAWFRNLVEQLGDRLVIRIALLEDRPIAGILTIRHTRTMVYKYGCSDTSFNQYGAIPLLFWNTIEEAKELGCTTLDLGRSGRMDAGLVAFKDRWNALRSTLKYVSYPSAPQKPISGKFPLARKVVGRMPDGMLRVMGSVLYKHFG